MSFRIRLFVGVALIAQLWAQQTVEYRVRFPNVLHHEAEVQVRFSGVVQATLDVEMSRSSPGRYALHEFAKNVYRVKAATPEGKALPVTHPTPYSWQVSGHNGSVDLSYTLFGDRADGTYAGIDETHAHLNPPAAFVWARGFERAPVTLIFEPPPGSHWRVATQLAQLDSGSFTAPNMAALMDSPIELSNHTMLEWQAGGQTFRVALHQQGSQETALAYANLCQKVTLELAGVFGAFPKFDNGSYTFLVDYLPHVFNDGMEHRNSTSISGPHDLENPGRAVGTASHEFFHAWNVRRMRPRSLEPFDFERANMSGELWFAEGFTSYYGVLALRRAGITSNPVFFEEMSQAVDEVLNRPGHAVFSAVEMSELAPFVDAATSVDATNFANTFISYYDYGAALALGIDLAIRERFPGKSLDDWMRIVWQHHPDIDRPYTLQDLQQELAEATGSATFAAEIFEKHILGKAPLDYGTLLAPAGLKLRTARAGKAWVGVGALSVTGDGLAVGGPVLVGSPAYAAGLERGDVLLRCDGKTLKKVDDFQKLLSKRAAGDILAVEVRTRSGVKALKITLGEDPTLEIVPFEEVGLTVSPEIETFRRSWLDSKAIALSKSVPVVLY